MLGQCCVPNHNTPPTSSRGAGAAAIQKNSPTVSPRRVRGNGNTKQTKEGEKNDTDWEGEGEDYASHGPPSPPNLTPSSLMPRRAARSATLPAPRASLRGRGLRIPRVPKPTEFDAEFADATARCALCEKWVHKPKALPVDLQLALVPQRDRLLASPSATPSPLIRVRIRIHRTPVHETRTSEAAGSLLRS
ncbi:hypothetical protein B0H10DRAFT_1960100 [Mycena sp. CBHHK59/15]|nr:hypothetical protein B0H10DRAFT_1960100 [Mycena sp. CBHHK59/15]